MYHRFLQSVIRGSDFEYVADSIFPAAARRAVKCACTVHRKATVRISPVVVTGKTMEDRHRPSVRAGAKLEDGAGIRSAPACCRAIERSRRIGDEFRKRSPKWRK